MYLHIYMLIPFLYDYICSNSKNIIFLVCQMVVYCDMWFSSHIVNCVYLHFVVRLCHFQYNNIMPTVKVCVLKMLSLYCECGTADCSLTTSAWEW